MSAESKMTIHIRLLSGESLDVETPLHTTRALLYEKVFTSLPDSLRPNSVWQLTLLREETETAIVEEEVELSLEEKITLLIDEYEYEVEQEGMDAVDVKTNEHMIACSLEVRTKNKRPYHSYTEKVYRTRRGFVEGGEDVRSVLRRCGSKLLDWEEAVTFPENKHYFTANEWFVRYLTRMKEKMNLSVSSEIFVQMELEKTFRWMKR